MNEEQIQSIRAWYTGYAARFCEGGARHRHLHALKRDHTLRVARNAIAIAGELRWPAGEINVAEACALLHDCGRFEQMEKHKTLSDARSFNHAERGRDLAVEMNVLAALDGDTRDCVLAAVYHHNRAALPDNLPARTRRQAALVRDADKLDIYEVVQHHLVTGTLRHNPELVLDIDFDGPVTPELFARLRADNRTSYQYMRSLADFCLIQVSWVYDMNYAPTFRRVLREELLERAARFIPRDSEVQTYLDAAAAHARRRAQDPT